MEVVEMIFPHGRPARSSTQKGAKPRREGLPSSPMLLVLREIRRQLADYNHVPPYVVASNRTLEELAQIKPTTEAEMMEIHGMGPVRFERYGAAFLGAIRETLSTQS